jgi:hypothetical protein
LIDTRIRIAAIIDTTVAPMNARWKPLFNAGICSIPRFCRVSVWPEDIATIIARPSAEPI